MPAVVSGAASAAAPDTTARAAWVTVAGPGNTPISRNDVAAGLVRPW